MFLLLEFLFIFLVLFCLRFFSFFLSFFTPGSRHQSFRVCKVNLATLKVAINVDVETNVDVCAQTNVEKDKKRS